MISRTSRLTRHPAIRVLLVGVAMVLGLILLGGGTSASAETNSASVSASAPQSAAAGTLLVPDRIDFDIPPDKAGSERSIYNSEYRTINRWGDSTTSFFTKYDGFVGTQLIDQAQRGVMQSVQMSIGNFFADATSNAAQWAVSFDAVDALGANIDAITQQIVKALFTTDGSGGVAATVLISSVIAILLISIIWQSLRRGGAAVLVRRLGGAVVILALLFTMASAALGTAKTDANGYHPVPLSPGWVVKTVNDSVSTIAEAPANLFITGMNSIENANADAGGSTPSPLSCSNFELAMQSALSTQQARANAAGSGGLVAITAVMDQLWEETGLRTWRNIQTGFNNPYGQNVYCRILEDRSVVSTGFRSALLTAGGAGSQWMTPVLTTHKGDNAPFSPDNALNTSATYVGWAACKATDVKGDKIVWEWADGWEGFQGGVSGIGGASTVGKLEKGNAPQLCDQWWNAVADGDTDQSIPDEFDISGEAGWIDDRTKGIDEAHRDEVRDFLYALTGVNATGGATATWAYSVSAFLQFLAFGFLAVLTFLTKLFCAMFAFSLWFVLLGALFSENPFRDRILKAFNKFFGMVIFASMMTAIMVFVVMFSRILIGLGDMFGPGSIFAMLWSGFAPLTSLILVHLLFTKVFRMPSPVTIGGARAWHKAGVSGALGTAAAAGVGAGIGSALSNRARNEGRRAGSAALHKATGGRLGNAYSSGSRRSGMGAGTQRAARDAESDETVEKLTPRQVRKQLVADRKKELSEARGWHQKTTGTLAPGDIRGSLSDVRARSAQRTPELAQNAQDKLAATTIARELRTRGEHRSALREARKSGDTAALQQMRDEQRAQIGKGAAAAAAVMDAPAAIASRARLGVEQVGAAAKTKAAGVWNSPKMVGARSDAAIIGHGGRAAAAYVKQSDVGRATAVVGRYAGKPVRAAARGTAAVAARSKNNAAVIEQYRAAKAAAAAPEAAGPKTSAAAVSSSADFT